MSAKVIPLWRPKTFTSAEAMLEEVRTQIFKDGRTYKVIAEATEVSASTIINLASGKTQWPRPKTLFPLMTALGLKMQIIKAK